MTVNGSPLSRRVWPMALGLAGEATLPEPVRQHRDALRVAADWCVRFGEHATDDRLHAKHRERITRVELRPHRLGERAAAERLREAVADVGAIERRCLAQRAELVGGHRCLAAPGPMAAAAARVRGDRRRHTGAGAAPPHRRPRRGPCWRRCRWRESRSRMRQTLDCAAGCARRRAGRASAWQASGRAGKHSANRGSGSTTVRLRPPV